MIELRPHRVQHWKLSKATLSVETPELRLASDAII
jgi:hypothetical protein